MHLENNGGRYNTGQGSCLPAEALNESATEDSETKTMLDLGL